MPGILKFPTQKFMRSNSAPIPVHQRPDNTVNQLVRSAMSQIELSIKEVHFTEEPLATVQTFEIDREEVLYKRDMPAMRKIALMIMPRRGPLMKPTGTISCNSKKNTFANDYDARNYRKEMACKAPEESRKLGLLRSELVLALSSPAKRTVLPQTKRYKNVKSYIKNHNGCLGQAEKDLERIKSKSRVLFNNEKLKATKALLHAENDLSEEELEKRAYIFAEHKVERTFTRQAVQLTNKVFYLKEGIGLLIEQKEILEKNSLAIRALSKMNLI
ncbi:MAG: hypothetical protein ACI9S8_001648 [Chlamydiales bacterium]|jgi:hypothetical protein